MKLAPWRAGGQGLSVWSARRIDWPDGFADPDPLRVMPIA